MEGLRTIKGRKHKSLEISQTLWMCVFGGSRAVSPLSISGISEVRANTSSELRAAPGMPRDGRFGSHGRRNPAQSPARTLSGRGNDMLASEAASWQRQEQSPEPDRAHRWRGLGTADRVAHGSDELAQMARHAPRYAGAACVRQGGQAQAPYTPYSLENVHDRGGDGHRGRRWHVAGKGNRT